jgi:hypothetical protein
MMMRRAFSILVTIFLTMACSHNPYLEQSLTRYQGKDKAWIEKELGAPDAKASRFFGGEKWIYNRIAGGKSGPPLFNFKPNECQTIFYFDKEDRVADTDYSGC